MPPRRRQAIDVLLAKPSRLLVDDAEVPTAENVDAAHHNAAVVIKCMKRYHALVDACEKSAPVTVKNLLYGSM